MMQVYHYYAYLCPKKCVDYEIHLNNNFFSSLFSHNFISKSSEIPPSSSVSSQIIIREHATPSSCDTIFADAVSSVSQLNNNNNITQSRQNLSVSKLEQFDIASDIQKFEVWRNESFNVSVIEREFEDEDMPIVKNSKTNGQDGSDKGIFNVSRIKKVELSEIPLASDICNNACK